MKRLLMITVAVLLMAAVTTPVLAWEFSMTGQWEYRLRYWARLGGTDLFGYHDVGNNLINAPVGLAGPNVYNRGAVPAFYADSPLGQMVITRGGFSQSESDAFQDDSRIEINPVIRVNSAIWVYGRYNVGGIRHKYFQNATGAAPFNAGAVMVAPLERYATFRTSENAYDTAAIGSWEMFRATLQLPWGILALGAKDYPWGLGAVLGYNTRSDSIMLIVPYGPLRFQGELYLARGLLANGNSHATVPDSATKCTMFNAAEVVYDNGPISLGAAHLWFIEHLNHREIANLFGTDVAAELGGRDVNLSAFDVFMKYNNGRVFTNKEYVWVTSDLTSLRNNNIGGAPPRHDEAYAWFSETGAFAGPAKVALAQLRRA